MSDNPKSIIFIRSPFNNLQVPNSDQLPRFTIFGTHTPPQHMGTLSKIKKKKVKAPILQYKYSFLCISFFYFLSCKCIILSSNFFSLLKHLWSMWYIWYTCVFKWFSMRLLKYCKSLKIFFLTFRSHTLWAFNGFVCILLTI